MASKRLNWLDKILGRSLPDVPANKKFTFGEVNELRDAVNDHATEIDANAASIQANSAAIALRVQIADIVNTLTSDLTNKPLSAAQGKVLKGMIDNINTLLTSDETTLDTLQEVVDFIEQNKDDLDNLTISNIAGLSSALAAKLDAATFNNHAGDSNNPHAVTKAQVGLGNVDNTSDADKPVSTAQATAIDSKLPKSAGLNAILKKTQAEYDALTPDANTLYVIV